MRPTRLFQVVLSSLCLIFTGFFLLNCANKAEPVPAKLKPYTNTQQAGFYFTVIGDSGSGASFQKDIAKQLVRQYEATPFPFILHLGDIIYPNGEWDKLGASRYKNIYAPLFQQGVKMRPVLGNHDVRYGYKQGTLEYYQMPNRYYTFSYQNVDFFAIDTNIMNQTQRNWLDKVLRESKAQWKIVYAHHPVYSSGAHRSSHSQIRHLAPILAKHHVDFYLAGHDHNYERFRPILGVTYVVSGGGGAYLRDFIRKPENNSFIRLKKHHFLHFYVNGKTIRLQAIDKNGQIMDSETYTQR